MTDLFDRLDQDRSTARPQSQGDLFDRFSADELRNSAKLLRADAETVRRDRERAQQPQPPSIASRAWELANTDIPQALGITRSPEEQKADFARDDGFLDRLDSGIGRGLANVQGGLSRLTSTISPVSGARDRAREDARRFEDVAGTQIAGNTDWEAVKANPTVGNVARYIAETSAESVPGMVLTALPVGGLGMFAASQTGNIAQDRAQNSGREDATLTDTAIAAPFGIGSAALERTGIQSIFGAPGKRAVTRIAQAAGGEALTEAGQGALEYTGGTVGTDKPFDVNEMADQMLAGSVAGAGMGGGIRTGVEAGTGAKRVIGSRLSGKPTAPGVKDTVVAQASAPTPEDVASPLPTETITAGRAAMAETEATPAADAMLAEAGMPATGSRVEITMPGGERLTGIMRDAFETDAGPAGISRGMRVELDDGSDFAEHFDTMADAGVRVALAADPRTAEADAIDASLRAAAQAPVDVPTPAAEPSAPAPAAPAPATGSVNAMIAQVMPRIARAESPNDTAKNPNSSAQGRYQFTDGTWLAMYERTFGKTGESREQILAKKVDGAVQDRVMQTFTRGNVEAMQKAGVAVNPGTIYLSHFAGAGGAIRLLQADPNTPVEQVLGKKAVAANPFLAGKTVGETIAWAARKVGSPTDAGGVPSSIDVNAEPVQVEWTDMRREEAGSRDAPSVDMVGTDPISPTGDPAQTDVAVTTTGREIPVEYRVVEAADLIASNDEDGNPNPAYPARLQPRDRRRGASQAQIADMAANLNPRLLGRSPKASDGAPIVSREGVIESGNGRTLALRRAYAQGGPQAEAYRAYLTSEGFDVSGFQQPVLVRQRGDMADADVEAFTREANARDTLGYSATEQAISDGAALSSSTLDLFRGGDIDAAANRDFLRSFFGSVATQTELAGLVDASGRVSQQAVARVRGALLAKAYGDEQIVGDAVESTDSDIRAIIGALTDVAGQWAQMAEAARAQQIDPAMDITANLTEAVGLVSRARREGKPLVDLVGQGDMFGGDVAPRTKALLGLFFNTRDLRKPAGRQRVADRLRLYIEEANKTAAGDGLFGAETKATPDDIVRVAQEKDRESPDRTQADLLARPADDGDRSGAGRAGQSEPDAGAAVERSEGTDLSQPRRGQADEDVAAEGESPSDEQRRSPAYQARQRERLDAEFPVSASDWTYSIENDGGRAIRPGQDIKGARREIMRAVRNSGDNSPATYNRVLKWKGDDATFGPVRVRRVGDFVEAQQPAVEPAPVAPAADPEPSSTPSPPPLDEPAAGTAQAEPAAPSSDPAPVRAQDDAESQPAPTDPVEPGEPDAPDGMEALYAEDGETRIGWFDPATSDVRLDGEQRATPQQSRIDDDEPVAILRGDELGALPDPGRGRILILRDRARQWFADRLGGRTITASDGKPVTFGSAGRKKSTSGKGDIILRAVPAIEAIIMKGQRSDLPARSDRGMKAEMFSGVVEIDGERHLIGAIVRTDENGRRQYDLTNAVGDVGDPANTPEGGNSGDASPKASVSEMDIAADADMNLIVLDGDFNADAAGSQASVEALQARLRQLGIDDKVSLAAVDRLGDGVAGEYAQSLITVALESRQDAAFTLNHEAIHALRDLGLIRSAEWSALSAAARRDDTLMDSVRRRYADLDAEGQVEEAVADRFARWAQGRSERGFARSVFERVRDWLNALGQALRGQGLTTAESVMRAIERGDVGGRAQQFPSPAGAPSQSRTGPLADATADVNELRERARDRAFDALLAEEAGNRSTEVRRTVASQLRKALIDLRAGRGDDAMFERRVERVLSQMWQTTTERRYRNAGRDRARGADYVRERLLQAKRRGQIDADTADFAEWFAMQNPALLDDLAIGIREAPRDGDARGQYNPAARMMMLFNGRDASTTAVHEMLHHTERMMPEQHRAAIRAEWTRRVARLAADGTPAEQRYAEAVLRLAAQPSATNMRLAQAIMPEGEFYQFINPSEFFAVNGADLLSRRYAERNRAWGRVRNWFREMVQHARATLRLPSDSPVLRALGDLIANSDGELSGQMLAPATRYASILARRGNEETPPAPRERQPGLFDHFRRDAPLGEQDASIIDVIREKLQDRMLPVLRAQQAIERSLGRPLAPGENPYVGEELMTGRIGAQLERLADDHVEPLFEAMQAEGLTIEEVETFLYARHAPERNARIARINPEFQPGEGSGMTDAEAAAIMEAVDQEGKREALEAMAARVDAVLDFAVEKRVEAGLLSQEEALAWRQQYKHYVPLRGEGVERDNSGDRPRTAKGISVKGKESKRAFGRKSRASDILAYSIMQAEEAIARGETNRVARRFYELANAHPDPGFWKVDKIARRAVWNSTTGQVEYRSERRIAAEDEPYTVSLKIGGTEHRVTMNRDNPAAARLAGAMRNMAAPQADFLVRYAGAITRFLSTVNTTLSPEFVVTNAVRDIQTAGINLAGIDQGQLVGATLRLYRQALVASTKGAFKKRDGEWGGWYQQFLDAGGRVYFNEMADIGTLKKRVVRAYQIADARAKGQFSAKRAFQATFDTIERLNNGVENAVRLAAFRAAREGGMSAEDAASLAKNLTVNFNRRGAMGPQINALYMFFNASVQGTARMLGAMRSKRVRQLLIGTAITGFAIEMLNAMVGDDDEDGEAFYDKLSSFDKARNLIIMLPGDGGSHLKVPLPYGYSSFFQMGRTLAEISRRGGERWQESMGNLASEIVDAFNPVGGNESLLNFLAPTIADPLVDLQRNRDYADRPILPEQSPYGPQKPDAQRYFNSVSPIWKAVTDTLTSLTGGDEVLPGAIDVSPETLEHLAGVVLGAAGSFVDRNFGTVAKLLDPVAREDVGVNDIPFARRVVGKAPPWYDKAAFYDRLSQVETSVARAKEYLSLGQEDRADTFIAEQRRVIALEPVAKAARKEMRQLRKERGQYEMALRRGQIDQAQMDSVKREVKAVEDKIVKGFNSRWNDVMLSDQRR
jgi:hypothetical protein